MKCKLITLCLSLVCICSFGGSLDADDIPEFVAGASNAVNIVGGINALESYLDICTGLAVSISALKVQYTSEMLRYQADWNQLTERLERGMGKHGENADQLEKIRLILVHNKT